jgi:hypothetical protein
MNGLTLLTPDGGDFVLREGLAPNAFPPEKSLVIFSSQDRARVKQILECFADVLSRWKE